MNRRDDRNYHYVDERLAANRCHMCVPSWNVPYVPATTKVFNHYINVDMPVCDACKAEWDTGVAEA